jgi:large subunit ribosomal protein L6
MSPSGRTYTLPRFITLKKENDVVTVSRNNDTKQQKSSHGLYRSLLSNAVKGVETGWNRRLEVIGTGFNAKMQGQGIILKIGFSHPVIYKAVEGIQLSVEGNNIIVIFGADKQLVGQVAHQIKMIKKPDIYKGKGIRYEGERIKLKPGKKAKTA